MDSGQRRVGSFLAFLLLSALVVAGIAADEETAPADDGSKARLEKLETEFHQVQKTLQICTQERAKEKDELNSKISSLELKLKDVDSISESCKRDLAAQYKAEQAKAAQHKAEVEAAERRAMEEGAQKKRLEAELEQLRKEKAVLGEKLKKTEEELKTESGIVASLSKELPPLPNQAAAAEGPKKGLILVERVKQTLKHQDFLAKEVEKLKGSVANAEKRLKEVEEERVKRGKAETEIRKMEKRIEELEQQAAQHKQFREEVSQLWLPPWLVETIEAAQDQANHHWEKSAKPAFNLARSKSMDAIEYGRKQAEPHLASFLKASKELARSTRDTMRPHLETARERHQEAMKWLSVQRAEIQRKAEPHVNKALESAKQALEKAHSAASPYIKQASDVVSPYYQEAYAAAKPGLDAMQQTVREYWTAASKSLAPQLEQLAETSAQYQRQVSGIVGNVTQQVAGAELSPDVLLFAEVAMYLLTALTTVLVILMLLRVCFGASKAEHGKKGKGRPTPSPAKKGHAPHHVKKAHERHRRA